MMKAIFSELSKRGHKLWSIPIGRSPTQVVPHIELLKLDIRLKVVPQESHGCLLKYIIDNLLWMSHPNALTLSMPASFAAFALVSSQAYIYLYILVFHFLFKVLNLNSSYHLLICTGNLQ